MENECDIVKDLLPNYISGQISETSKKFVENHIKDCKQCAEILECLKRRRRN